MAWSLFCEIPMSSSEIVFKIIKCDKCPCYALDDKFKLSGNALLLRFDNEKTFITTAVIKPPADKKTCRVLLSDINKLLIENESVDKIPPKELSCSGCSGIIKVEPQFGPQLAAASITKKRPQNIDIIAGMLSNFSIFQSLDRHNLRDIVSMLSLIHI